MLQSEYIKLKPEFDKLIEDYVSGKRALSYSAFKSFIEGGPRAFFQNRMIGYTSKAMDNGIAAHMCVLEYERYLKTYFVFDDTEKCVELIKKGAKSPRSLKAYKDWKEEYLKQFEGMEIITKEEDKLFKSYKEYLRVNNLTRKYMNDIKKVERKYNFEHEGFNWTVRVDGVGTHSTADLKFSEKANPKKMRWEIKDRHYDLQGVVCAMGAKKPSHNIISINKSHEVSVYILEGENLDFMIDKLDSYISRFRQCIEEDAWDQGFNYFVNEPEYIKY